MEFYREGGSDKHLRDIASMLAISGSQIDRAYVDRWAARSALPRFGRQVLAGLSDQHRGRTERLTASPSASTPEPSRPLSL